MSDSATSLPRHLRRHPSAGNLGRGPTVVRDDGRPPVRLPGASFPHGSEPASSHVRLGPDLDDAQLDRLLGAVGPLEGRRVLDLGCAAGSTAVCLARRGARVIGVESSTTRLARARHAAEVADVRVEFHHSDLADLAFLRADSIDLVVAVYSLSGVADLGRVVRQLHRVMRPDAALVLSLPHPASLVLEVDDDGSPPFLARTHWNEEALVWRAGGDEGVVHVHQIGDVVTTLVRSNFRVDALVEPPTEPGRESAHSSHLADWVPTTLVVRARKEGT